MALEKKTLQNQPLAYTTPISVIEIVSSSWEYGWCNLGVREKTPRTSKKPTLNFGVWTPKQRNCPSCLPLLLTRSITRSRVTLHSPAHLPHPLPLLLSASISTRVSPDVTLQSRASVWCAHCLVHCWCNAGALPPPPPLPFYCPSPSPSPHPPPTPRHHTRRCGPYHRIAAAEAAAAPPQSTFASKSPRASGCLPHTAAGAALHYA